MGKHILRKHKYSCKTSKTAARLIIDADYSNRSKLLFSELKWVPFPEIVKFHQLSLVFKCINTIVPTYLHTMFRPKSNDHTYLLRSSGTGQSDVPRQHTRSLSLTDPKLWNNLNKEIRNCTTLSSFKSKLKHFCYVLLDEHYVNSYTIYVCLHLYELSHFLYIIFFRGSKVSGWQCHHIRFTMLRSRVAQWTNPENFFKLR